MNKVNGHPEFLICLRNDEFPVSLELRKIYRAIDDSTALRDGMVRIVDESGEDYLYPASYFAPISLPDDVRERLLKAG